MNIDRTVKNTNLLNWNKELWLIDHGASLYFHHNWDSWARYIGSTFPSIKDHVLLKRADKLEEATIHIKEVITKDKIVEIVNLIPEDWLVDESTSLTSEEMRKAYISFLCSKLDNIDLLAKEAEDAR